MIFLASLQDFNERLKKLFLNPQFSNLLPKNFTSLLKFDILVNKKGGNRSQNANLSSV